MPQGDAVLVKTSGGRPAVRRVWQAQPGEVLIVHDEYYRRWERHPHLTPQTYSVSRQQVFQDDAALAERLGALFARIRQGDAQAATELEGLWGQALPYTL